jgi:mRNA interferase RelE/StbE
MYDVLFTETALRQLRKMERETRKRIIAGIERIRIRPGSFVRRLVGEPYYRLRIGDYRAILDISHGKMTVMVLYVGHRKSVYKKTKR